MPELPEVETVVRGLRPILVGKTIGAITMRAPKSSIVVSPTLKLQQFEKLMTGRKVTGIARRGKNILISLSGHLTLWVHLKMTGHFSWVPKATPIDNHDLLIFDLADTSRHLRFNDYRRFGRLRLFRNDELWQQKGLVELGPEPLEITAEQFVALCHRRPRQIKQALLDQSLIAGIGNIYADESLYYARIHPRRLTTSLARAKLTELHGHIQRILRRAIRLHGTSVDTYTGVNGQTGSFQSYLKAYGNEGEPCERCGAKIVRERIGSRSAHYCPRCQRLH
ncbi:DNA-formamidopyrimidine glycosylase [candidate division GN15 bacterium]|uniref:Formamidopyrimidine-DNA glycosylase n=1 Tax=candidate division GN15 bacterium TaxID=2072418 RepID=A0A855X2T4_9BACT|nr:MAG: DNA-formamidopyrimidine glycosylase [candidate division GN15 bacterium]